MSLLQELSTATQSMNRRLKLCYKDTIRMVLFTTPSTLEHLKRTIRNAFKELGPSADIRVSYEDSAKDCIFVASDADLALALQDSSTNVPKFTIEESVAVVCHSTSKECTYFKRDGWCRAGDKCKFSHSTRSFKLRTSMSPMDVETWLAGQLEKSASDNIQMLSSSSGLQLLQTVVECDRMSSRSADMLARLLSKEEVRCSMLKEDTNRIYGAVMGSRYLMQLQAHINSLSSRTAESLQPYLLLMEQIQLRNSAGWKYVPLDTVKSALEVLPESPLRSSMHRRVTALLEHRRRLQVRMVPSDNPAGSSCLTGAEFRAVSIIPDKEELMTPAAYLLPVNRVGTRYSSVIEYLETHFRLLREDFIEPLRKGIRDYRDKTGLNRLEIRVYGNVQLVQTSLTADGVTSTVSFTLNGTRRSLPPDEWKVSKRLMFGALLCVTPDNFETIIWATVVNRKGLKSRQVDITLLHGQNLEPRRMYTMVESSSAYFEAYFHVLRSLQREDMENIPFTDYLVSLEHQVREPIYLNERRSRDVYYFVDVFSEMESALGRTSFRILQEWPEFPCSLDVSQLAALKHALTKSLTLIQGPPGTGKTFVGLLIVKSLLANLKVKKHLHQAKPNSSRYLPPFMRPGGVVPLKTDVEEADIKGPILVVCYTNHALDQFLLGILKFEKKLVRVGGGSENELLEKFNLKTLCRSRETGNPLLYVHARTREDVKKMESEMNRLVEYTRQMYVMKNMLHGVATEEQIASLFQDGSGNEEWTVRSWLDGENLVLRQRPSVRDRASRPTPKPVKASFYNTFECLDQESENSDACEEVSDTESELQSDETDSEGEIDPSEEVSDREKSEILNSDLVNELRPAFETELSDVEFQEASETEPKVAENAEEVPLPLEELINMSDVWSLPQEARVRLHQHWLDESHAEARLGYTRLTEEYQAACKQKKEINDEIKLSVLRKVNVVGMTTTGAARLHDMLTALQPEIVIVEEAAEVLEGHILASLSPHTKHLILIGDHLQLRPSVATYELAVKNKLDVSMFERLVESGVEHAMLQTQRRMKPSISKLISGIYPSLRDHPSVSEYEDVRGLTSSLFFMDHKALEEAGSEAGSKKNVAEASLIVELCSYLLNQGCYQPKDISVLAMYKAQVQEITWRLIERLNLPEPLGDGYTTSQMPRVSSVDEFQGEENDIILLSLVRSNVIPCKEDVGKIGFLNTPNRVCVALSRARKGLYIFGNAELLSRKSSLWESILRSMQQDGLVGPSLTARCQNHPNTVTSLREPADFRKVEDGGCNMPCEYQLDCGHACPRRCHPGSHDLVICPKPCYKLYEECDHRCERLCHGQADCPPCSRRVVKQLPVCGHEQVMECSQDVRYVICNKPCEKTLACGHTCRERCESPCQCSELVVKELPCGHQARMLCSLEPSTFPCQHPCGAILEGCDHKCRGSCESCKRGTQHKPCEERCGRDLPCGHRCQSTCSVPCPPCSRPCEKRCVHSKCSRPCGKPCRPCREKCGWQCKHLRCESFCHEVCRRERCNEPCRRKLRCRHRCIGLCGEPCPKVCRVCHPDTKDGISLLTLEESENSDRFIQLQDCRHVFEVTGLDQWMDMEDSSDSENNTSQAIVLKSCPECRTPIRRTYRYANVVKARLQQIEEVKRRVYAYEATTKGFEMLGQGKPGEASKEFMQAIRNQPGLFEAHLGQFMALCYGREYRNARCHLRVIVHCSPLASETESLLGTSSSSYSPLPKDVNLGSLVRTGEMDVAIRGLLHWASIQTNVGNFQSAVRACDTVLKYDNGNTDATEIKREAMLKKAHKEESTFALKIALGTVVGRWYKCPNGHIYSVGECGRPMETSVCPDCRAAIGGRGHVPIAGNVEFLGRPGE